MTTRPATAQNLSLVSAPEDLSAVPTVEGIAAGDAETIDMWQYFVEHIDEFAVAKSLVDHFDAYPKDLHRPEIDTFALYLRAKITLKRNAVSYAEQQAMETAVREAHKERFNLVRRTAAALRDAHEAVRSNSAGPAVLLMAIVFCLSHARSW
jgi:hypothetical protein